MQLKNTVNSFNEISPFNVPYVRQVTCKRWEEIYASRKPTGCHKFADAELKLLKADFLMELENKKIMHKEDVR